MVKGRTALQLAATLGGVAAVYAIPWVLAALGSGPMSLPVAASTTPAERPVVVWQPTTEEAEEEEEAEEAEEQTADDEATGSTEHVTETRPAGETEPETSDQAVVEPRIEALAAAAPITRVASPDDSVARLPHARTQRRVRKAHRKHRAARAPKELTRKQRRRIRRARRRRARLARQPQCHELADQIVQVDDQAWWVGRELANCYRAHPLQFARIGGLRWLEDDDAKRVGLKVFVSRSPRGDVARAIGIERGDVLRSLNGIPLRSTAGSGFAMAQLIGGRATLKVRRDDEEHRIRLRVVGKARLAEARLRAAARDEAARLAEGHQARRAGGERPARPAGGASKARPRFRAQSHPQDGQERFRR